MTRAIGYVRVSTGDQAESGAGLEAQREAIRAECERRGWELLEVYDDGGASGSTLKRPGLERALGRMTHSGPATPAGDVLVAAKLDRLSRSVVDFATLLERSKREGWSIVCLDVGVDTSTPQGEMLVNVLAAFAQFERRLIGERTKDALAARRAAGVRLGRPPAIYGQLEARILLEHAGGRSLRSIAAGLELDGVPTVTPGARWHASTVARVVNRARAATAP